MFADIRQLAAAPTSPPPTLTFPANFNGKGLSALLRVEHPRLIATSEDWQRIRRQIPTDPYLTATKAMIVQGADNILPTIPLERVLTGRRLLFISREVLNRVLTLATAYRVTDDPRYFERARSELLQVAAFTDWNPPHFLDTAEMTMAVAIGYDWLYHELSATDRNTLRQAILEKGLKPGSGPPEGINYWKLKDNNWVQVCFAGLVAGALAVAEDEPELAAACLSDMFSHIHQSFIAYAPDGIYPGGPKHWVYGTHYSVMLLSLLRSAVGTAWNLDNYPGFQASAVYINQVVGPTGCFFNFSDGDETVGVLPALHWFAAQARDIALDARERRQLLANPQLFDGAGWNDRYFPLGLLWLDAGLSEGVDLETTLPLNWSGQGLNPIATLRTAWEPNALYVGVKAGRASHDYGHMDIGSFVMDWKGVRWAVDLGDHDHNTLESLGMNIWGEQDQNSERWKVFRISNLSHNTLVIDGQLQLADGFAPIVKFSDHPSSPFAVIDMSAVYANSVPKAMRGVRLMKNKAVLIQDELEGLTTDQTMRWGMMTRATVDLHGNQAVLRQDGQTLHAQIVQPEGIEFVIVSTAHPEQIHDEPNPGTRMLAVFMPGGHAPRKIQVVLSDYELSSLEIDQIIAMPTLSEW